ncbi:uncharacterized protein [Nicotiana tomentosiformis]|uniref:uncharacterized protein n=1 Tax=Nicotiana tomentosiformis TaxID=4098 RepID=UPI00388CBE5E
MAKTSKFVPQNTAPSDSTPAADIEVTLPAVAPEPPLKDFILGGCSIDNDFKVDKASKQGNRGEEVWRFSQDHRAAGNFRGQSLAPIWKTLCFGIICCRSYYEEGGEKEKKEEVFWLLGCSRQNQEEEDLGADSTGGGCCEVELSSAREHKEKSVVASSQEATPIQKAFAGIIDFPESPSLTDPLFDEAQAVKEKSIEASRAADEAPNIFFEGMDVSALEDYSDFSHLEIPKRDVLPRSGEPSLSSKLAKQFPAPSVDPDHKKTVMFMVPEDTRMLFGPVDVASYLRCLVPEEDQAKMNEVNAPSLFNEAHQVLNKSFHWSRMEVSHLGFELKEQVWQKDMYKALSEKKDKVLRQHSVLQDDLERAQKEASKVQKKIDLIDQLRAEMNEVKAPAEELRSKMVVLASERDATKEDMAPTKDRLRVMRENTNKWSRLNEELKEQLNSVVTERDTISQECSALKSKLEAASNEASEVQDILAQYKNDVEVVEARVIIKAKYVKWLSQRENLEEIHARGVDFATEIEEAKSLEAEARERY